MKKFSFLTALFAASLVLALGSFGCKTDKKDDSSSSSVQITEIILSDDTANMVVGDIAQVRATSDGKTSVSCEWVSSDTKIATVNEYGDITAVSPGKADITASVGDVNAKCAVTVTLGGNLPSLSIESDDFLQVDMLNRAEIGGKVFFAGIAYDDASITYTLEDNALGKVEDGVFTPLKKGETTLTVSAEWRGIQSPYLTKEITVKVIDNVLLKIGGKPVAGDLTLGMIKSFEGETYDTELTLMPELVVNGNSLKPAVTVGNTSVAEYDAESEVLSAVAAGSTTLTIGYVGEDFEFSQEVNVTVLKPIAKYADKVDFSTLKGIIEKKDGTDLFATLFDTEIVAASMNGKTLAVSGGKITDASVARGSVTENQTIVVENDRYGYEFTADCCALFVKVPEDLLNMVLTEDKREIGGYICLCNDIDMTNFDINGDGRVGSTGNYFQYDTFYPYYSLGGKGNTDMLDAKKGKGFTGVFDGRGHKINNFHMGNSYGFFGNMNGAAVRNVAYTNTDIFKQGMIGTLFALNATNVQIENVYVSINVADITSADYNRKSYCALFGCADYTNISFTDFLLEMSDTFDSTATGVAGQAVGFFGSLVYTPYYVDKKLDAGTEFPGYLMKYSIKSVYVIAKPASTNGRIFPLVQQSNMSVYASNDFADIEERATISFDTNNNPVTAESGNMKIYHWANAWRYDSYAKMIEAGKTKVGSWDISSGAPVYEAN